MNRNQSKNHRTGTYEISKTSLLCFYDKKHIINSKYDELPLDYQSQLYKKSCLNNCSKHHFCRAMKILF